MVYVVRRRAKFSLIITLCAAFVIYIIKGKMLHFLPSGAGCVRGWTARQDITRLHHQLRRHNNIEVDKGSASWRLWNDSWPGTCNSYTTRFGRGLEEVWLVSYPGSGNTWLRYLLEASTGIFTGSRYNETTLRKKGFLGEGAKEGAGVTLVQKTHGPVFETEFRHDLYYRHVHTHAHKPTILLLRNPARAIISSFQLLLQQDANRHTKRAPLHAFNTSLFRDYVNVATSLWEELYTDWLLASEAPLHVLHYEHLRVHPVLILRRLLRFLSVPEHPGRLLCLSSHLQGHFKRGEGTDLDPFTAREKQGFKLAVDRVTRLLMLLGYPTPPY